MSLPRMDTRSNTTEARSFGGSWRGEKSEKRRWRAFFLGRKKRFLAPRFLVEFGTWGSSEALGTYRRVQFFNFVIVQFL